MDSSAFDKKMWLRQLKSRGPDWDTAVEYGVDVDLLLRNLQMTMSERFAESVELTEWACALDATREQLYGPKKR